jgi:transglutaminase-like putative cysteine protease
MQNNMATRVSIQHQTSYRYERPVFLTTHYLRLKPAAHTRTPVEDYQLSISPENHLLHWQQDPFGNFVARVDFTGQVSELKICLLYHLTLPTKA